MKEHYFRHYSFTNFTIDHEYLILTEISGDIHVCNFNFDLIKSIKNTHSPGSFVIQSEIYQPGYSLLLYSNSNIVVVDHYNSSVKILFQSKLKSNCDLKNRCYYDKKLQVVLYKNETNDLNILKDDDEGNINMIKLLYKGMKGNKLYALVDTTDEDIVCLINNA